MHPFERKASGCVVKIGHFSCTIMASQTFLTKILAVLDHENRIIARMTIRAGLRHQSKTILTGVAVGTIQRRGVIIDLMPDQTEMGLSVVEKGESGHSWVKIPAFMIGMASPAFLNIL